MLTVEKPKPPVSANPLEEAVRIHRNCALAEKSCYSSISMGRFCEEGLGVARDLGAAYQWYARAWALQGHPCAAAGMKRLAKKMKPAVLAEAKRQSAKLKSLTRPLVHLAGAWGFPDFKADRTSYARYAAVAPEAGIRRGYLMLKSLQADVEAMGWTGVNPWIIDVPELFIDGVMFGAGPDAQGKPWSEGNLAARTMPAERLRHWLAVLAADFRVDPALYSYGKAASIEELEELYRGMVLDVIYQANKHNVAGSDVIFAELNAYRGGDTDDGTLFEVVCAVEQGKPVIVLVDESPEAALNEGIFGKKNRWNVMVSGYLREHPKQVRVFHDMDRALDCLKGLLPAPTGRGRKAS